MARELVTRKSLRRNLAVNAATKPVAVVSAAGVAVAALVLGVVWLLAVAPVIYLALVLTTYLDADEAAKVGQRAYERARRRGTAGRRALAPAVELLLERARDERRKIAAAVADADLDLRDIVSEVDVLAADMERFAASADRISRYLDGEQPDYVRLRLHALRDGEPRRAGATEANARAVTALEQRLRVVEGLEADLERFQDEMEHLIATLGVVHAHIVRAEVASHATLNEDVASELRDLRERVGAIADAMGEAAVEVKERGPS